MASSTARTRILGLFQKDGARDPADPIPFATVLETLSPEYTKGTVSARLSELVEEGVLERSDRGSYRLVYTEQAIPDGLADLVPLLADRLGPQALQGTVVWDATPVLADSEDGVMAPVRVVETERATGGSMARTLLDHWRGESVPYVEAFGDRAGLLEAALGAVPVTAPSDQRRVLVGPAEGHYAATMLHPATGIRRAGPERVLADLLRLEGPWAGEIVYHRLTSPNASLDPDRLRSAVEERGLLPDLFAVLTHLRERLPDQLRDAYHAWLRGAARTTVRDRHP